MLRKKVWEEVDLCKELNVVTATEVIYVRKDTFKRERLQSFYMI